MQLPDLTALIQAGETRMDDRARRLWHLIAVPPAKWALHPWADDDGGFWVVALLGRTVVWYNEIEEGFNTSPFSVQGTIDEYWCDQLDLNHVIVGLLRRLETDAPQLRSGPPRPFTY